MHEVAVAQQVADVEAEHVEQAAVGALWQLLRVDELTERLQQVAAN